MVWAKSANASSGESRPTGSSRSALSPMRPSWWNRSPTSRWNVELRARRRPPPRRLSPPVSADPASPRAWELYVRELPSRSTLKRPECARVLNRSATAEWRTSGIPSSRPIRVGLITASAGGRRDAVVLGAGRLGTACRPDRHPARRTPTRTRFPTTVQPDGLPPTPGYLPRPAMCWTSAADTRCWPWLSFPEKCELRRGRRGVLNDASACRGWRRLDRTSGATSRVGYATRLASARTSRLV